MHRPPTWTAECAFVSALSTSKSSQYNGTHHRALVAVGPMHGMVFRTSAAQDGNQSHMLRGPRDCEGREKPDAQASKGNQSTSKFFLRSTSLLDCISPARLRDCRLRRPLLPYRPLLNSAGIRGICGNTPVDRDARPGCWRDALITKRTHCIKRRLCQATRRSQQLQPPTTQHAHNLQPPS